MQKNDKIDSLPLVFMPFTGNKSPGAKKGSDEWQYDNFTNIFWVKRTFIKWPNSDFLKSQWIINTHAVRYADQKLGKC